MNPVKLLVIFILCVTVLMLCQSSQAQPSKSSSLWYFGSKDGLDFKTDPPTILTDGEVENNYRRTCTMADEDGNLLFYTDGEMVWDRNHQVMENGTGLTLIFGDHHLPSVIVRHPGNADLYFIFTAALTYPGDPSGLHYAIVDISANGGLGKVITKNINIAASSTYLLSAVADSDNKSIWVMGHEHSGDKFYAVKVTESGIQTPVFSTSPGRYEITDVSLWAHQMTFSPDGKYLAVTVGSKIELYRFDSSVGSLALVQDFHLANDRYVGVAFSPASRFLYGSTRGGMLYQIDMNDHSALILTPTSGTLHNDLADLQLAFNGKIYGGKGAGSNNQPLLSIDYPDIKGNGCTYRVDGIMVPDHAAGGLPVFVQSDLADMFLAAPLSACENEAVEFSIVFPGIADSIAWSFGDGVTETIKNPVSDEIIHHFTQAGNYQVTFTKYSKGSAKIKQRSIEIYPAPTVALPADTTLCEGELASIDAVGDFSSLIWSTGATTNSISVSVAGKYWVKATVDVCEAHDTIEVAVNKYPVVSLPIAVMSCNDTYTLNLKVTAEKMVWSDGSQGPNVQFDEPGHYVLTAANGRCSVQKGFTLTEVGIVGLAISPSLIKHLEDSILTFTVTGENIDSYEWSFGDGLSEKTVLPTVNHVYSESGAFDGMVTASNSAGCSSVVYFHVDVEARPIHVFVPNVFTPNGDGKNDFFELLVESGPEESYRLSIYNRMGKLLLTTNDPHFLWAGEDFSPGVYYYHVSIGDVERKGWVHLMR